MCQVGLETFEAIGRRMVQKCGCLPLAISVVGGILRQKRAPAEWENVSGNIDSYLKLGEGFEINKRVKHLLDLRYDVLPYYLKPCFLYLACFPEDKEIKVEELYLLWIAEGLISSQDKGSNESLIDVVERYLSELAFRCMVRVQKVDDDYRLAKHSSCRLHDLIRDLSLSKAEDINFLKFLSSPKDLTGERPSSVVTSSSRLVVCFKDGESTTLSTDGIQKHKDLRSLLIFSTQHQFRNIIGPKEIIDFGDSKRLRVLRLNWCRFEGRKLLRMVGKLIHLRYLSLAMSEVEELPQSICNMPYLETLDLMVINKIKLPNVIWKMKRLRHLLLRYFSVIGGDKLKLDGLEELETLIAIDGPLCITDIPKLTNLRKLFVKVMDMDSASKLDNYMRNYKSQLREAHLLIENCDFISEESEVIFRNILMSHILISLTIKMCKFRCGFPSYQQGMCRRLRRLGIYMSKIEGDLMGILGQFPVLRDLVVLAVSQPNIICVANSFPELKYLCLNGLENLRKWEVEERAMPKLTELVIVNCKTLEELPLISTLRELIINYMPKEFNDKLRVVNGQPGEDYHKVSHIPFVHLIDDSH